MDQSEIKEKQSLSQLIKSQFQRKLAKLLLSVSVFSLFFSHSYWLSLLHSSYFNFHNTLPFKLFSHTIDKNCIFLLCNGLLVFLAKYSGLISSSTKYNNDSDHDHSFKSYEEPKAQLLEKEIALESTVETLANNIVMEGREEEEAAAAAAVEEEREAENFTVEEEEEDGEKWGLIRISETDENAAVFEEEDDEQEFGGISENYEREEEEVEMVEGNRVLSTEELNKKFDEFIRRMKEELRIEARQQLVMV